MSAGGVDHGGAPPSLPDPGIAKPTGLGQRLARAADVLALAGMLAGAALMFQPWWRPGLGHGFWTLLGSTLAHIVTSHLVARGER